MMEGQVNRFLDYCAKEKHCSANTQLSYAGDLRQFLAHLHRSLGHSPKESDFTVQNVQLFLARCCQKNLRPATIRRKIATLNQFAKFLGQPFVINPELFLANSTVQSAPLNRFVLQDDEIERLKTVDFPKKRPPFLRNFAMVMLLLETGMSAGRLIQLNLADVEAQRVKLPGSQTQWQPLCESSAALQQYLKSGRPELNGQPDDCAFFISQKGKRITRQAVWQGVHQFGKAAGLSGGLTPQQIRHTAAYKMHQKGLSLREIQVFLGHQHPQSTQNYLDRLLRQHP